MIPREQLKLLGLLRAGLQRSQMSVIGPQKLRQHVGIKRVTLRLAHTKAIPDPIQRLGIDRIDHHPMIQKKIYNPSRRFLDGRPQLDPLSPALIKPTAKLGQPLDILQDLLLHYFLAFRIADPHLMKLIGPIHSHIVSLHFLFLLLHCVLPIPIAVNGKFALYRSSPKGQLSIEPQIRSLAGRDSLPQILRGNRSGWVLIPASC